MTIAERSKFCKIAYQNNEEFRNYIDKLIGKGGNLEEKSFDEIMEHLMIYDICMYYLEKERKNGENYGKHEQKFGCGSGNC